MSAETSAAIIHDKPKGESFDDLYHLFIAKVVRLPIDPALSEIEEKRLVQLFVKLNELKREKEQ